MDAKLWLIFPIPNAFERDPCCYLLCSSRQREQSTPRLRARNAWDDAVAQWVVSIFKQRVALPNRPSPSNMG